MSNPITNIGDIVGRRGRASRGARTSTDERGFDELVRAVNLYDLSDVPVASGRIVPGALIRCAKLDNLSAREWATLMNGCNFGLVVDLRTEAEIPVRSGMFSKDVRSACTPCAYINLPLDGLGLLMTPLQRKSGIAWVRMRKKLWADPEVMFKKMYAAMVTDPNNMHNLSRFFSVAQSKRDGALAWHCAQGTDRTGVVSALLLEILGAKRADIVEHYAACYAHDTPADPRPSLLAAYDAIEGAYGSVQEYLTHGLGVTPEAQHSLQQRFLA